MNSRLHSLLLISIICMLQSIRIINGTDVPSGQRKAGYYLWKDFPLDEIAKSPKFRGFYFYCFGGAARCPIDGIPLMEIVPYMIKSKCKKCTKRQRHLANTVLAYLRENEPEDYLAYYHKYDPTFNLEDMDIEIYSRDKN